MLDTIAGACTPRRFELDGVESIAIDPVNPHILHLAVDAHALDKSLNSGICRAADGGSEHYLLNLTS